MQIYKGTIVTCDQYGTVTSYLAEEEGRIIFVGDELPFSFGRSPAITDLGDKALLPAFGDGHIHFSSWALFNSTFDVRGAEKLAEIGPLISDYARREPKIKVLFGFGHSANAVAEQRLITRSELDAIVKDRPIYLVCYDGHSAVVNTAAIGLLPKEIRLLNGFNLESGQLFHEAFLAATDFISAKIPPHKLARYMLQGMERIADYGVGLIHTAEGVGFPRDLDIELIRFLTKSSQLQFRIYFQTMDVSKALKRNLSRIGGCFACALDGCFGARDAALLEPYSNDPNNRGILFYSDEQVNTFMRDANRAGLQVQLHCIGDAAVVQAVNAIENALADYPRIDHRHTLIHASLIPGETLRRIADLGIVITLQPGFLISPLEPASYMEEILGERSGYIWPVRKMIDLGIMIGGGSDAPVTAPNPIEGLYALCNRTIPEQSATIEEALRMYTYNLAYTSFDERERGSLEKGKIADLVILNRNPLALEPQDLLQLKVETLLLAGQPYQKGSSLTSAILSGIKNRSRTV